MINYLIPTIVLLIIIYGLYKKVNIYEVFLNGVEEGLNLTLKIFPTIFAMIISINVLLKSNIITDLTSFLSPIFSYLHFPKELLTLSLLKNNGPDSLIGRIASVIQGSTDTTIYIISLYFSSVGIKKTKYALLVGLLTDLICIIISTITVKIIFT